MSAKITFKQSPCNVFVQSPGKARETGAGTPSTYQVVAAFIPIWGWAPFNLATNPFNFAAFQSECESLEVEGYLAYAGTGIPQPDNWPNVFSTLTENWAAGSYPNLVTVVSAWSQYCDLGLVQTSTGLEPVAGVPFPETLVSASVDMTNSILTVIYLDSGGDTITYTATLSGSVLDWLTATTQALALLADVAIPAGPANSTTVVYPVSTSPGYAIAVDPLQGPTGYPPNYGLPIICAAARGAGLRFFPTGSAGPLATGNEFYAMAASIMDSPTSFNAAYVVANQGGVICVKSTWQFNGADHNNVWLQPVALSMTGVPYFEPITGAPSIPSLSLPLGPNGSIPPWPCSLTFQAGDATVNGGTYALLGFRNPAA